MCPSGSAVPGGAVVIDREEFEHRATVRLGYEVFDGRVLGSSSGAGVVHPGRRTSIDPAVPRISRSAGKLARLKPPNSLPAEVVGDRTDAYGDR